MGHQTCCPRVILVWNPGFHHVLIWCSTCSGDEVPATWVSRGPEATLTNALGPRYHYEIVNTSHFGRVNASHFRGTGRQPSRDTTQPCPSLSSAAYAFISLPAYVRLPDMLRDERYVAHCHLSSAVLGIQDMHSSPCNNCGVFTNFMRWKSHFSIHSFTPVSIYSVIHLASL